MSFRAAGNATAPTMGLRDPRFYQPLDAFLSYRKAPGGSEPQVAGLQGRRRGKRGGRRGCRGPGRETRSGGPRGGMPPTHGPALHRAPPIYPGRAAGPPSRGPCKDPLAQALVAVRPLRGFCRKGALEGGFWRPWQPRCATCRPVRGTCRKTPLQGAPTGWPWRARPRPDGRRPDRRENGTKVSGWWDKSVRPMGHCISKKAPGAKTGAGICAFSWCPR